MYKEFNRDAYTSWESVGIVVPPITDVKKKLWLGAKVGAGNLSVMLFGAYSFKLCSIPM